MSEPLGTEVYNDRAEKESVGSVEILEDEITKGAKFLLFEDYNKEDNSTTLTIVWIEHDPQNPLRTHLVLDPIRGKEKEEPKLKL